MWKILKHPKSIIWVCQLHKPHNARPRFFLKSGCALPFIGLPPWQKYQYYLWSRCNFAPLQGNHSRRCYRQAHLGMSLVQSSRHIMGYYIHLSRYKIYSDSLPHSLYKSKWIFCEFIRQRSTITSIYTALRFIFGLLYAILEKKNNLLRYKNKRRTSIFYIMCNIF